MPVMEAMPAKGKIVHEMTQDEMDELFQMIVF
jgi:hypothetical protein